MSLETRITEDMKTAMRNKDKVALETIRAIKSALLLAKTETGAKES
ncbi:MAG: GatB/YqeY domain-containing protein, partial [Bacteroidetes bacterium]